VTSPWLEQKAEQKKLVPKGLRTPGKSLCPINENHLVARGQTQLFLMPERKSVERRMLAAWSGRTNPSVESFLGDNHESVTAIVPNCLILFASTWVSQEAKILTSSRFRHGWRR